MRKEVAVTWFEIEYQHLLGGTEKNCDNHGGLSACLRFEPNILYWKLCLTGHSFFFFAIRLLSDACARQWPFNFWGGGRMMFLITWLGYLLTLKKRRATQSRSNSSHRMAHAGKCAIILTVNSFLQRKYIYIYIYIYIYTHTHTHTHTHTRSVKL